MDGSKTRLLTTAAAACLLGLALLPGAALAAELIPARLDSTAVNPQPLYPNDAQLRGEEGSVDLSVYVSSTGRPTGRLKLIKSSGFGDLDNSAVEAVLGWHFMPAQNADGDAESAWQEVRIDFKLPPPPQPQAAPAKPPV
ncbi:MAG: energy transducer TonB [Pseudomonadota bacterium]|nr:energy transducer TonB [Pseudomonadota bacterium]